MIYDSTYTKFLNNENLAVQNILVVAKAEGGLPW